jgi:hypothetical protein
MAVKNDDKNAANNKKHAFEKRHYKMIAKVLGHDVIFGATDANDYRIVEAFAKMFAEDNPSFNREQFISTVYDMRQKNSEYR